MKNPPPAFVKFAYRGAIYTIRVGEPFSDGDDVGTHCCRVFVTKDGEQIESRPVYGADAAQAFGLARGFVDTMVALVAPDPSRIQWMEPPQAS